MAHRIVSVDPGSPAEKAGVRAYFTATYDGEFCALGIIVVLH